MYRELKSSFTKSSIEDLENEYDDLLNVNFDMPTTSSAGTAASSDADDDESDDEDSTTSPKEKTPTIISGGGDDESEEDGDQFAINLVDDNDEIVWIFFFNNFIFYFNNFFKTVEKVVNKTHSYVVNI